MTPDTPMQLVGSGKLHECNRPSKESSCGLDGVATRL